MFKYLKTFFLCYIILVTPILTTIVNGPELFDKAQKVDRLVLKNQIGYHFKKVVREVSQELFISRKVDISALFLGIQVLNQTKLGVERFCRGLSNSVVDLSATRRSPLSHYTYFPAYGLASIAEANAICQSKNLQLPEVYNDVQKDRLSSFLSKNNISYCFAGIMPDVGASIQRYISTGYPAWKTSFEHVYMTNGETVSLKSILDDVHAKFLYTAEGRLVVTFDDPTIIQDPKLSYGSHKYWESHSIFSQVLMKVVCEPP
jgi:hypothetical protein